VSWLGPWHLGMGAVARIMAWVTCPSTASSTISWVIATVVARVTCLGSAREHHVRPRGMRHGMGGGTRHVS
jgi:hypothetical protein